MKRLPALLLLLALSFSVFAEQPGENPYTDDADHEPEPYTEKEFADWLNAPGGNYRYRLSSSHLCLLIHHL